MSKPRYTLIVDGVVIWQSDSVRYLKEKAAFYFDYLNAYCAEIRTGKKTYSCCFYDGKWSR